VDSRAWLVGLGLLASALAALLVADLAGGARRETDGGRIVPEWSAGDVRAIRLERSGLPPVLLERSRSGPGQKSSPGAPTAPAAADPGWRLRLPSGTAVPVDPAALRDLTGTIEMLAATRRDPAPITAPRLTIVLERDGGPPIRLLLAAAGPGRTDRVWLARAGQGGRFLIDGYAARALDVGVDPLRERRPLHGRLDGVGRIEVATGQRTAILTGPPWRIELPGGLARAAAARVQDLLDRARDLRIASFTDGPPASPDPGSPLAAAHGPVRVSFAGGARSASPSPAEPAGSRSSTWAAVPASRPWPWPTRRSDVAACPRPTPPTASPTRMSGSIATWSACRPIGCRTSSSSAAAARSTSSAPIARTSSATGWPAGESPRPDRWSRPPTSTRSRRST